MFRKYANRIVILILSIIMGYFLVVQLRNDNEDYTMVSLQSIEMMKNEIQNNQKEIINLEQLIEQRNSELMSYEAITEEKGSISTVLSKELEKIKMVAAVTDVHGPGIMLRMEDNNDIYSEGEDLNLDIIHDFDVTVIINDLKLAGAEAISINGKRLVTDSEVKCGGPIITINDEVVAVPFIIKAIGDPKVLSAAINAPNTYGYDLKEIYGIKIQTLESDDVQIPRYSGSIHLKYAEPVKKEGE